MELFRYLVVALAFANRANALSTKASLNPRRQSAKAPCTLPSTLPYFALLGNGPGEPSDARKQLLDAVASPLRKTTPFVWLHYGDGDFASMGGESSGNEIPETSSLDMGALENDMARRFGKPASENLLQTLQGPDLDSKCVRDGLRDMFLGKGENLTSSSHVYQSVGAFFLCHNTFGMQNFLTLDVGEKPKFPFHDDFYLPCGDGPPGKDGWIAAARKRKRPVVIVGPKHLDQPCALNHAAFFEIPSQTEGCDDVDRLVPQLVEYSRTKFPDDSVLFAVAGGAIGKMIAYQAFQSLLDKDMFVDVGASLDLFSGHNSRGYANWESLCTYNKHWLSTETCIEHCEGNCDMCAAADVAKAEVGKLLHLLVEDEKKSKKETEEKESKARAAGKKQGSTDEFEAFLPGCLQHTSETIQTVDRSYTDAQLKTVLQNECLLSKEFPAVHDGGFKSHKACMDFADKLADARMQELKDGNTKDYDSFCESFYEHQTGKKARLRAPRQSSPPVISNQKARATVAKESIASGRSFSVAVLVGVVTFAWLQK